MEFYNKYSFANDKFSNSGDRIPLGYDYDNNVDKGAEWWAYDFEWKAEYGLADWMSVLFDISYENATYKEHARPAGWGEYTRHSNSIKYIAIGGKVKMVDKPLVVSYQIMGYIAADGASKLEPSIGKNDDRIEFKLLLGKSFKVGKLPAYAGFETGYRVRALNGDVADDVPLFLETGVVVTDWLMVTAELDNWLSVDNTGENRENLGVVRGGIILSPSGQFNQFRKGKNNFNVAVQGGYTVWGKNTNAAWEVIVKLSTQFDVPAMVDSITSSNHPNTREVVSPTH
jgi:hypothetical protein